MPSQLQPLMDHPLAVATVTTVGGALTVWGGILLRGLLEHLRTRRDKRKTRYGMRVLHEQFDTLRRMRVNTRATRVLLLSGHNSGGYPRAGAPFYVTVTHSDVDDNKIPTEQAIKLYRDLTVDAEYVGMLLAAEAGKTVMYTTETMPPCQLKRYYQAEGVKHAVIVGLGIRDKEFHYVSIATHNDENFTDEEVVTIELMANALRALYR